MAKSLFDAVTDAAADAVFDAFFGAEWTGRRGEKLTERELKWVRLLGRGGKILRNVYVPKADGATTEIDVMYVTVKGIFVIESKNYSGWIFGSEDQRQWTVSFPNGSKERFYNPVKQNQGHVKWLREHLGDDTPLFSIIAFSERCELKKVTIESADVKVVKRDRLYATVREIWDSSPDVMDDAAVEELAGRLLPLTKVTKEQKARHVEDIRSRHGSAPGAPKVSEPDAQTGEDAAALEAQTSDDATKCPKCGSPMVLRTAKRGANAGNQFYGCSNYPKCRGVVQL